MAIAPVDGHIFQTFDEAETVVKDVRTKQIFLGSDRHDVPGPEAYMVEQGIGIGADSHFHKIDQFQIIFGGEPGDFYQRTPLPKWFLHYADGYSVYGPFGPGPNSTIDNLNMRAIPAPYHGSMPGARDQLLYNGHRHHQFDLDPYIEQGVPSKGDVLLEVLVPEDSDGLAAYLLRIGPGTDATPPVGELRTGRYTLVIDGEMHYDGRSFGPKSLGWSSGDAPEITIQGGPDGALVLFLYYPYPDTPSVRLAEL